MVQTRYLYPLPNFSFLFSVRMAPSAPEAAMGKIGLTAKALTGGGFESLYKQTFHSDPSEQLKKTFACYLSTATGPVAGTLYLTNLNVAFCSDRPLSFTAPSGQIAWGYYKVCMAMRISFDKFNFLNNCVSNTNLLHWSGNGASWKNSKCEPGDDEREPAREIHSNCDGRRARILVHGFRQLRQSCEASAWFCCALLCYNQSCRVGCMHGVLV